jgi:hypothetical protein
MDVKIEFLNEDILKEIYMKCSLKALWSKVK